MADGPNDGREGFLVPGELAALVAALGDPSRELRIAAYEALTRLPLGQAIWTLVGDYCAWVLASDTSELERLAVIDSAPWIPLRSTRELLARLASGHEGETRARAARAVALIGQAQSSESEPVDSSLTPIWAGTEPRGFVTFSDVEMTERRRMVSRLGLTVDRFAASATPFGRIRGEAVDTAEAQGLGPIAVTALFEKAARDDDIVLGNDIVYWVARNQGGFRPHLEGLFAVYRGLALATWHAWTAAGRPDVLPAFFAPGIERIDRYLCWQVAWTVSRGGLRGLVPGLARWLSAGELEERLAAACLVADVAGYLTRPVAPFFGGGWGPERSPIPATVLEDTEPRPREWPLFTPPTLVEQISPAPEPASPLDDDVQFTVYRPGVVRPQRWYRLVAFAHKTTPVEDVDGTQLDPVREVSRQAEEALRDEPAGFAPVAVDSAEALRRGGELLFEPWLEEARLDPERAWLRWEAPVHQVSFRFRVPAAADGRRLEGGLRVFVGVLLIGEVRFRITVSGKTPMEPRSSEPVAVKRYRQVFASYSHKDNDLVREVASYLSVTGDRYFVDVQTLRSGERWESRLTELIDQADLFQLFWSRNAMRSEFVRREWEYALALGREGFVRPVYWEDPLPEDPGSGMPPDALRRLHFARLPIHGVPATPAPSTGTPQSRLVCRRCGFHNGAGQEFCGSCGTFLEWTGEKVQVRQPVPPMARPVPPPVPPPPYGDAVGPDQPASAAQPQANRPTRMIEKRPPTRRLTPGDLICGACGEGNAPVRKYCSRCGSYLAEAQVVTRNWWQRLRPRRKQKVLQAGQRPGREADPRPKSVRRLLRAWLPRAIQVLILLGIILAVLYFVFPR